MGAEYYNPRTHFQEENEQVTYHKNETNRKMQTEQLEAILILITLLEFLSEPRDKVGTAPLIFITL